MTDRTPDPAARLSHRLAPGRPLTSDDGADRSPTVPLSRSGNPRPARARTLHTRLSERDRAILRSLAELRLMTGRQLQRLYVTSSNPVTAARRTRAVLRRLTELQAVVRLDRRVGGIQAGSDGHVYGLSGLGQAVLVLDGQAAAPGRTVWETKPTFQDHLLAVSELAVGLHELARGGSIELLAFDAEPGAWRFFTGPTGARLPLKPDAFVALGIGEFEQRAFVELDCGTESLPTIERKCRRYLDYWHSGLEQRSHGVFPRVWWLASSQRRYERLASVITGFNSAEQAIFSVGLAVDGPQLLAGLPAGGGRS